MSNTQTQSHHILDDMQLTKHNIQSYHTLDEMQSTKHNTQSNLYLQMPEQLSHFG